MKIRNGLVMSALAIGIMVAVSLWAYFQPGPDQVPVHWNARGEADGYASRFWALALGPMIALPICVILAIAAKVEPRRENLERSATAYMTAWAGGLFVITTAHLVTVAGAIGIELPVVRIITAAIGLMLVALGDVIGKSKSNFVIGVRTPWTLSSERSWNKTNRAVGRMFVAVGIASAVSAFLVPPLAGLVIMLGGTFVIVVFSLVYSWAVWRSEQGNPQA